MSTGAFMEPELPRQTRFHTNILLRLWSLCGNSRRQLQSSRKHREWVECMSKGREAVFRVTLTKKEKRTAWHSHKLPRPFRRLPTQIRDLLRDIARSWIAHPALRLLPLGCTVCSYPSYPMIKLKKPARKHSYRYRFLRLTTFDQVELRTLKKHMVIVQSMLVTAKMMSMKRKIVSALEGIVHIICFRWYPWYAISHWAPSWFDKESAVSSIAIAWKLAGSVVDRPRRVRTLHVGATNFWEHFITDGSQSMVWNTRYSDVTLKHRTATLFKYLLQEYKLRVMKSKRVSKVYTVATLIRNFYVSLYGSQTSNYFDIDLRESYPNFGKVY